MCNPSKAWTRYPRGFALPSHHLATLSRICWIWRSSGLTSVRNNSLFLFSFLSSTPVSLCGGSLSGDRPSHRPAFSVLQLGAPTSLALLLSCWCFVRPSITISTILRRIISFLLLLWLLKISPSNPSDTFLLSGHIYCLCCNKQILLCSLLIELNLLLCCCCYWHHTMSLPRAVELIIFSAHSNRRICERNRQHVDQITQSSSTNQSMLSEEGCTRVGSGFRIREWNQS